MKIILTAIIIICFRQISAFNVMPDTIPPAVPQGVQAFSYEKHIDVDWESNTEPDLVGYKIYKWNGNAFTVYTLIPKDQSFYISFQSLGTSVSYKVTAYDASGNESDLSDSVFAQTGNMTDEEFLTMTQRATFRYFWDHAHPVSGLSRERFGSGNTVTSGGSGFGIMALLVGIERNFITREQGAERLYKIINFLLNNADRFHGAYAHWFNGETGEVIPFSQYDDGGDLVETSFLLQGLLTARQYFNGSDTTETNIRNIITQIWETTEFSWYTRSPYSTWLYWHWSPNYSWQMNFKLIGWNETMIAYLLGIASTTYHIPASMYYQGWASSTSYANGSSFFGYPLWVGWNYGGPLFFAHYSFLGFDPRFLKDNYANYFNNNRNHTLINRAYCIANPKGFQGYNENCWGLTASDDPWGYSAHEPYGGDNGTITPSAALSSMPYTPLESIEALKYMYRTYSSSVFGNYGFKDAFNISQNWFANSYIAIDQGPIIIMIENYRSQLLWNNFMANPEIQDMVDSIFVPDTVTSIEINNIQPAEFRLLGNYPNPFNPNTIISFNLPSPARVEISIYNSLGEEIKYIDIGELNSGKNNIEWDGSTNYDSAAASGIYLYKIKSSLGILTGKMVLNK